VRPYRYASPTILTLTEAQSVAAQILAKVQGTTETFAVEAMGMSALDGGDIVRLTTYDDVGSPATMINHFLQSLSLDLVGGGMSAATQSSVEVAA
jgi:hypothetical protein